MTDITVIQKALSEHGELVKAFRAEVASECNEIKAEHLKFGARILDLEQRAVRRGTNSGAMHYGPSDSVGAQVIRQIDDSTAFSHLKEWNAGTCRTKLQTSIKAALTNDQGAISSEANTMPSQPERRGMIGEVQRPLRLLDALPSRPVEADAVEYVKLTSSGDAAEQELEGDDKAEIDLSGTLARAEIVTIAGWTAASKQVLSDHAALQGQIDRVLRYKVLARLEDQLINGVGGQGKIEGLRQLATPFVPSVVVVAENAADRVGAALAAMRSNGYSPNLVIMNPNDWFAIQTAKSQDEEYLFGSPIAPVSPALWNVTIVTTPSMPEGDALALDTAFVTVLDRETASVMLSNSHADFFTRNLVAILGELRAGLEVTDEFAVYKFTLSAVSE